MTTSKLDMVYGRQGGRIVPWRSMSRWSQGQVVALRNDLMTWPEGAEFTVIEVLPGDRLMVRTPGQVELIMSGSLFKATSVPSAPSAEMPTSPLAGLDKVAVRVLAVIADADRDGVTDVELAERATAAVSRVSQARRALARRGLVIEAKTRRHLPDGSQLKAWRVTAEGQLARDQCGEQRR